MESEYEFWFNDGTFCFSLLMTQYVCLGGAQNVKKWPLVLKFSEFQDNSSCSHIKNVCPNLIGLQSQKLNIG